MRADILRCAAWSSRAVADSPSRRQLRSLLVANDLAVAAALEVSPVERAILAHLRSGGIVILEGRP